MTIIQKEAAATVASIRTRVGQIKRGLKEKNLWAIDEAATKLAEAADGLESALKSSLGPLSRSQEHNALERDIKALLRSDDSANAHNVLLRVLEERELRDHP